MIKNKLEGIYILLDENGILVDFDKDLDTLKKHSNKQSAYNNNW